ncbi:MAG: M24 family metallopeptidase [Bryobacteraceae bacterium]
MPNNLFGDRRAAIRENVIAAKLDALLISGLPNIRYLTGFTGSSGLMLLRRDGRSILLTDPRYDVQAREQAAAADCVVRIAKGPLVRAASTALKRWHPRKVGFELARMSYQNFSALAEALRGRPELVPTPGWVEQRRMVKSAGEIEAIRQSVRVNSRAFDRALRLLRPGKTTEGELAAELDYQMRKLGAEGAAFETIVASGARAALPHARPTRSVIPADALLLIDMGAVVDGYSSDMTRVVFTGAPREAVRRAYAAVLEAQLAAVDAVRPGVKAADIDRAARSVLERHRLAKAFTHSTGHGLGLEIHEAPRLGRTEKSRLEQGMTVTIEPGVYLEGQFGIRIEDTVLVTAHGCEILTPTAKELRTV